MRRCLNVLVLMGITGQFVLTGIVLKGYINKAWTRYSVSAGPRTFHSLASNTPLTTMSYTRLSRVLCLEMFQAMSCIAVHEYYKYAVAVLLNLSRQCRAKHRKHGNIDVVLVLAWLDYVCAIAHQDSDGEPVDITPGVLRAAPPAHSCSHECLVDLFTYGTVLISVLDAVFS